MLLRHRQVCALKQPCDTTPPPRPVPRQLICFLHSETQDFAVFSDIIEPALPWSAHWSLPSSHALFYIAWFEMRFGDIRTTCPKYESRLDRTWLTTSLLISRSILMSTFLRRSHRLIPAIRLRTAISKTSSFRPISSVMKSHHCTVILIAPALCIIWSWSSILCLWISKLQPGYQPHQFQDRSVYPHLLQSRLFPSSSLPDTQTPWLVSEEHHQSLMSSHVPMERCTGLLSSRCW